MSKIVKEDLSKIEETYGKNLKKWAFPWGFPPISTLSCSPVGPKKACKRMAMRRWMCSWVETKTLPPEAVENHRKVIDGNVENVENMKRCLKI